MKAGRSGNGGIRGFLLMEIIVSIALFALIGTSMVAALQHMAKNSRDSRSQIAIYRRVDSVLAEVVFGSGDRLALGKTVYPADGSDVSVEVEITPENITDAGGAVLDSIYRVRVKGMLEYDPTVAFNTERLIYFRQQGRGEK
jgi:type II secretory pathway pseudopilin PulG